MRKRKFNFRLKFSKLTLIKLVSLLVLGGGLYWLYSYVFIISKIDCQTLSQEECPAPVLAELDHFMGQNLLLVETDQVSNKILDGSNLYKNLKFEKHLPATLKASLEINPAVVQLFANQEVGYVTVLENYIPHSFTQNPDESLKLIEIESSQTIELGQPIKSTNLKGSIDLIQKLEDEFITYKNFRLASDSAKVELSSGQLVLFDPKNNLDKQVVTLLLLKQDVVDENVVEIDLRFDKPILRYKQ